jgi:hypothetical protein
VVFPEVKIDRRYRHLPFLIGLLSLWIRLAAAQAEPNFQVQTPTPTDSLQDRRLLDRLDFHPSYGTSYSVNRTSRSWTNDFSLDRKISVLNLSHQMNLRNNEDKAQNGLQGKSGTMHTTLDYKTEGNGGWDIGLDSNIRRTSQFSSFRDQVDGNSDFGLTGSTDLVDAAMHRFLPFMKDFELGTSTAMGYSLERTTSRRQARLDSTKVGGIYRSYDISFGGKIGSAFSMQTAATTDRRLGDSKTSLYKKAPGGDWTRDGDVLKDKSDDRSRKLSATVDWNPFATLKTNAQGHMQHDINQYWDPQAGQTGGVGTGAAETKDGTDNGTTFQIDWNPSQTASLHGDMAIAKTMVDFAVQRRDFTKESRDGSVEGRVKLPSFTGPLGGTEIKTSYGGNSTTNLLQETGNYRQTQKTLKGELRRSMFTKLQLLVTQEITLSQYIYEKRDNERDEMRQRTDALLNYSPSPLWTGMFEVASSRRKTVNIPAAKSSNNNTTDSYKISGQVDYKRGTMSITQRYSIQADYTFYHFQTITNGVATDNNSLLRLNDVLTTFGKSLGHSLMIGLEHQYQFRDSGRYLRISDGSRAYVPSNKETRHSLTLTTSYPIGQILRIEARQLLDRRRSKTLNTGSGRPPTINTNTRGEFSLQANIEQQFGNDFRVSASFQKTESITEKDYWTVQAQVQRNF